MRKLRKAIVGIARFQWGKAVVPLFALTFLWGFAPQSCLAVTITPDPDLALSGPEAGGRYGRSVASGDLDGDGYDDVIVGAITDSDVNTGEGKVWVYYGSTAVLNLTSSTPDWSTSGGYRNAYLGWAIMTADFDNDGLSDLVIGVPGWYADGSPAQRGKVSVYYGSGSGLSSTPDWEVASYGNLKLGYTMAHGDVNGDGCDDLILGWAELGGGLIVYHGSSPSGLTPSSQSAYFTHTPDTVVGGNDSTVPQLSSIAAGNFYDRPTEVGSHYDDVFMGSSAYGSSAGNGWLYLGSTAGVGNSVAWSTYTTSTGKMGDGYGRSVANAGDVDLDGRDELIVGAYGWDNDQTNEGQAFVYSFDSAFPSAPTTTTLESDKADANFGYTVAPAGDIDGDGYADVAVGDPVAQGSTLNPRTVYVYYGSTSFFDDSPTPLQWSAESYDATMFALSLTFGDFDGDGCRDLLTGAEGISSNTGAAYLYLGTLNEESKCELPLP
jgi:hypothetical protein